MKFSPRCSTTLAFGIALMVSLCGGHADDPQSKARVRANECLDAMFSSLRGAGPRQTEEDPIPEGERDALIALGTVGWEETYKRFERGSYREVYTEVLGKTHCEGATTKLTKLLGEKNFEWRRKVPDMIALREPEKANEILRPFLADAEPKFLEAVVSSLLPLSVTKPDVEAALPLLGNSDEQVRFQTVCFLERATGHIVPGSEQAPEQAKAWTQWWAKSKDSEMDVIIKTELKNGIVLLGSKDKDVRERVLMAFITHSGQTYFGYSDAKVWWGSQAGWKQWLRLAYSPSEEDTDHMTWASAALAANPSLRFASLSATISMSVKDLSSSDGQVRALARQSMSLLLGENFPFRFKNSDPENDWLNNAIISWWSQRMKSLKKRRP